MFETQFDITIMERIAIALEDIAKQLKIMNQNQNPEHRQAIKHR